MTSTRGCEAEAIARVEAFRRRPPRLRDTHVTLAHGAGGKASAALLECVFLPAFGAPAEQGDAARLPAVDGDLAFTTDAYVVQPIRFPGGSIGELAVNGTVNDLAMVGAQPIGISVAFVLEEGLSIAVLRGIAEDLAAAAAAASVPIVTGDTKVVGKGAADQMFITTAGIGRIPDGRRLTATSVRPGDAVLVSGPIGNHGVAVMLARGDLAIDADIRSDTAPLTAIVDRLLDAAPNTRWMRDATRGGLGSVCNELAGATNLTMVLEEASLPIDAGVAAACELLGIDPLYVANEGRFIAVVPAAEADAALAAMRAGPEGSGAALIGEIRSEPAGLVVLMTPYGSTRIVDTLAGDPLPRIC